MITRYAFFEGTVAEADRAAFRAFVTERLVPLWTAFPGAASVRVMFEEERDDGAPALPLILAIDYPDHAALERAMASPARFRSREVTGELTARFFTGRIHHHVTSATVYPATAP
jgi:hypothetical protein